MLVAFNDSPKSLSRHIRPAIGRYMWRIDRDLWVWRDASLRHDVISEIEKLGNEVRVILIWKASQSELGYEFQILGALKPRHNKYGWMLHNLYRTEK